MPVNLRISFGFQTVPASCEQGHRWRKSMSSANLLTPICRDKTLRYCGSLESSGLSQPHPIVFLSLQDLRSLLEKDTGIPGEHQELFIHDGSDLTSLLSANAVSKKRFQFVSNAMFKLWEIFGNFIFLI